MNRRMLAILLVLAMLLGMLPTAVLAEDTSPAAYLAAYAPTVTVDGTLEAAWVTDDSLSDGSRFGVLWDSKYLYIAIAGSGAVTVKLGDQTLTVDSEGNASGIDGASTAVGSDAVEIKIPYTVMSYSDTVDLSIALGEGTWEGTLGFSSLVREDYSLNYLWELGKAYYTVATDSENLGGEKVTGGHRMWNKYIEDGLNSAQGRVYSGTANNAIPFLANRQDTLTLEYDFKVDAMPVYESWNYTRTYCCYGFSMAMTSDTKEGYVAGITNSTEGLRFCVMQADGEKSVLLGKELGETFHIRQDWTMDGDLMLYVDGKLLHTFQGTELTADNMSATGWANANVVIFNLWSDNRILESEDDNIDFTYSNLKMGKVPYTSPLDGLDFNAIKGSNADAASVTSKLVLPGNWSNGQLTQQEILWSSSAPAVVAADGTVTPGEKDTQVTLTASLKNDPSVTKDITFTVGKMALESVFTEAAITLDGVRGTVEAWPVNMATEYRTNSNAPYAGIASMWYQEKLYFFINYAYDTNTAKLSIADKEWTVDMSQPQVSDGALTGVVTSSTVELCLDLKAAGLNLLEYGVSYDFQLELVGDNGTARLVENPIVLSFVIHGEKATEINSSMVNTGLVSSTFNYKTLPIQYSGTGVVTRDYLFTKALADLDHRKDMRLDQTITVHAMPVSDGTVHSRLGIEGYCINICDDTNDSRNNMDIITAGIYNSGSDGLVLRVLQGGVFYPTALNNYEKHTDVKLNRSIGDTFKLSLRWNADNTLVVIVDGVEKATVEKATIWASGLQVNTVVLNYYGQKADTTDTSSLTLEDVSFVLCQSAPNSVKEEITREKLLGGVDLTAVSEDLSLPQTYTSKFLGDLPLTWVSDNENIIAPDGNVTRPAGTVGKYVELSLYVGEQKLFTVYPYVLPETLVIPASPATLGAAFSAAHVNVDGATTDEGWSMNTKLLTASGTQLGRLGAQWDAINLYLAIETGGVTPAVKLGETTIDLSGAVTANNVIEIAIPLSDLDITADEYNKEIEAEVTLVEASWMGTIVLSSTDWFATGSTAPIPPTPINGSLMIEGVGADQPTANQGLKNLGDGWQFFDTYDPEGSNPKQVRSYAIYMGLNDATHALYAPFADRSVASYLEFDFYAASMPEYTLGEATGWDNRWACYGFSWLLTAEQVDNYADSVAVGIYNSDKGLVFVALNNTTQTVLLNRQVGDLFRIGTRWNPDDSLSVFLDGELIAEFENMTVSRRAMGDKAVNLNLIRGAKAAESFNDNFDISITNLAFGKAYGDKLIDSLTFDSIRGENTDPYSISSNLTLPAKLENDQLDPDIDIIWSSSDPAIIAADGTVIQPETGRMVTLTATAANGDTKPFELYVVGTNLPEDVLYVEKDTDTAHGAGQKADFYRFTLDATNNSVIRDLKESKTVNVIALRDGDTVSRLNESVLTIWVSNDNVTYTRVDGFKLLRSGEYVYLYDFEATGRYIKVHCTHFDGADADFTAPLQTMIDAYYEDIFGANGSSFNEDTVTVTNSESTAAYDKVWPLDGEYQRVLLNGNLLYHCTEGDKTYVRIPTVAAGETVTLTVLSGNSNALDISNKEYTLEVVYGTREVVDLNAQARWIVGMPDGRLLNVMSVDEDDDGYSNNYIGYNWSYDGGLTWTDFEKTGYGYEHCVTVAGVMYDPDVGEHGRIIVQGFSWPTFNSADGSQSDCKTRFLLSDDLGNTWYKPENEMTILGDQAQYILSYTAPYKVSTADGEGEGVDYVIPLAAQPSTDNSGSFVGRIAYSCDGGLSWTMGPDELAYTGEGWYAYEVGVSEGTIIETDDGTLVYYGRCQYESMDYFAMATSNDFGKTWSEATESKVYTVNTQPMFHQFGDTQLLTWAGNTALGGNSYKRYPLNVAYTSDGANTFENIQNLWSRYSLQGLTEGDNLDVTNQSVASVGDTLMVTWSRFLMKTDSFTDYFFRTKGAYDSFENSTTKYEGWSTILGSVETAVDPLDSDNKVMKIVDGASAVRSIPYLQNGTVSFDLYMEDLDGTLQIELESAYSDVFGKAAPIALEIAGGKLYNLDLQQGWNTVSFDLALTDGSASVTVNGVTAELHPNMDIGDYICYVEIRYGTTVCYVDEFTVEDNDPQTIGAPPEEEAKMISYTLSLKDYIGINVYMDLSDEVYAQKDAYMLFTRADGRETRVTVAESRKRVNSLGTTYGFTYYVTAKEMADIVKAQFFYNNDQSCTEVYEYSVRQYAEAVLVSSDYEAYTEELRKLMCDMLQYGAYAQKQFNYNDTDLADKNVTGATALSGVSADTLKNYSITKYTGPEGTELKTVSLVLKANTTLRFYFHVTDTNVWESMTFKYNGQQLAKMTTSDGEYYVDVTGIPAKNLHDTVTVTVTYGNESGTLQSSPMAYCYGVLNGQDSQDYPVLKDLTRSLYLYNQAAIAYFNN